MATEIAGFFRTRAAGEAAYKALLDNGFTENEVSFVAGDTSVHEMPAVGPLESVGAESEAGSDAMIGGMIGVAAGVVAAAIPGLGPLFIAGPLAVGLGGMTAGAAAGGFIGWLRDRGIETKDAAFLAEGAAHGGALITIHDVDQEWSARAREILKKCGAVDTENLEPARQ
jgi:hypothetical protein